MFCGGPLCFGLCCHAMRAPVPQAKAVAKKTLISRFIKCSRESSVDNSCKLDHAPEESFPTSPRKSACSYHYLDYEGLRELHVWQKAHRLTLAVYQITSYLPREELYGLTGQLRRASASIAANLARDAEETAAPSWHAIARSLWDRPASWSITCCLLKI